MIIQCPACGARAKLPDSKQGAKVRCGECERIYVARSGSGSESGATGNGSTLAIGIGAGVIALIMILFMVFNSDKTSPIDEVPDVVDLKAPADIVDQTGWDSAPVKFARGLHEAAFNGDEYRLQTQLAMDLVWARVQSTDATSVAPAGFSALTTSEVDSLRGDIVQALLSHDPENLVGRWRPFDGEVLAEDDQTVLLHLSLEPRDSSSEAGSRNIEWQLVKVGDQWKAWSWERWYSEAELKASRIRRKKKIKRTVLSDGSQVIEAEPGPIPYEDTTSAETRQQIDALLVKLVDLELPGRESNKVKQELVLYGKEALPPLLTLFYEMNLKGFDELEDAIAAQQVHQMLSEITGYITTFKAHEALGASQERRDSGVRQWFGWYHRKFKHFNARPEEVDLLEESIELKTDAERREYEKYKRKIEQEENN
ncbi:MAG: zinc-ribbon domain-containing protein [bacterium]|jgi:predicted Zn finger-like uncharacterized protein